MDQTKTIYVAATLCQQVNKNKNLIVQTASKKMIELSKTLSLIIDNCELLMKRSDEKRVHEPSLKCSHIFK